jgi:hypothetical protein
MKHLYAVVMVACFGIVGFSQSMKTLLAQKKDRCAEFKMIVISPSNEIDYKINIIKPRDDIDFAGKVVDPCQKPVSQSETFRQNVGRSHTFRSFDFFPTILKEEK